MVALTGKHIHRECCTRYQVTIAGLHIGTGKLASAEQDAVRPMQALTYVEVCTYVGLKKAAEGTSCAVAVPASSCPDSIFVVGSGVPVRCWVVVRSGRAVCVLHSVRGCSRRMMTGPFPEYASFVKIPC